MIAVPPDYQEMGEEDCDGLPDCASWIALAADFTQDGATVTGSVTSTFAAPPNYAWTVQSGTVSVDGTLSLTPDELAFRVPDDAVEIRARLMSWGVTGRHCRRHDRDCGCQKWNYFRLVGE